MSKHLNCDTWLGLLRLAVEQRNKIRPCDDAAANGTNSTSKRFEKLETSSIDQTVKLIRFWRTLSPNKELGGWAVDKYKAYRQRPIHPSERKRSVVIVANPNSEQDEPESQRPNEDEPKTKRRKIEVTKEPSIE